VLIIQLLFCSDATPEGIQLTFPTCLLFGLGFQLCTGLLAVILLFFIEFPMIRLLQLTLMKHLSHFDLLSNHF